MLKKILLLTIACMLCFSLIACDVQLPVSGGNDDSEPAKPGTETPSTGDETPSGGDETPSTGDETPSTGDETPSTGDETPSGGEEPAPDDKTPEETPKTLQWLNVATYNILHCADLTDPETESTGGHGLAYPDKYVQLIKDYQLDIVGMNEVDINCQRSMGAHGSEYREKYMSNQPRYIAEKLTEVTGEQYYWAFAYSVKNVDRIPAGQKGDALYGNAIISRYPILSTRSFKVYCHDYDPSKPNTQFGPALGGGNQYEVKTVLIAEIDVDGTVVTVISSHYGLADSERALMTEKLLAEVEEIETPVILMGDLNSLPTDVNMIALAEVLNPAGGMEDTTGTFHKGRRIDWIFVSKDVELKDYKVLDNIQYSDHYPVTTKVGIQKQ